MAVTSARACLARSPDLAGYCCHPTQDSRSTRMAWQRRCALAGLPSRACARRTRWADPAAPTAESAIPCNVLTRTSGCHVPETRLLPPGANGPGGNGPGGKRPPGRPAVSGGPIERLGGRARRSHPEPLERPIQGGVALGDRAVRRQRHHHVRCQAGPVDPALIGREPAGDREAEAAVVVVQREERLDRPLAVRLLADKGPAARVLEGTGHDLGGRCRVLVDQDGDLDGRIRGDAAGRGRRGDRLLADRLLPVDRPGTNELADHVASAEKVAAEIPTKVEDDGLAARLEVSAQGRHEVAGGAD